MMDTVDKERREYDALCGPICSAHCAGPTNACDHEDGSCDQGYDAGYKGQLCPEGLCTLTF